jgi:hypothetical protein
MQKPSRPFTFLIAGLGLLLVVLGAAIAERALGASIAVTAAGVTVVLGSLNLALFGNLRLHLDQTHKQILSIQSAIALSRVQLDRPVFFLRHAVAPDFIELTAELVRRSNASRVLEMGSGASSLYLAALLPSAENGGRLVCLENDRGWAGKMASELTNVGSHNRASAQVIYAPLVTDGGSKSPYYDIGDHLESDPPFQLAIVDGPGDVTLRDGVFRCLMPYLSEEAVLLFDDGDHPAIKSMVGKWVKDNPAWSARYYSTVKGTWIVYNSSVQPLLPLP